jgi:hypothetical protein
MMEELVTHGPSPSSWLGLGLGLASPNPSPHQVTHGPVSKFLLPRDRSAGADMMLPGVIVPEVRLGSG